MLSELRLKIKTHILKLNNKESGGDKIPNIMLDHTMGGLQIILFNVQRLSQTCKQAKMKIILLFLLSNIPSLILPLFFKSYYLKVLTN